MHPSDVSMLHTLFVFAQGVAFGVLLSFVTLECMARAAKAHEDDSARDREAIDAEWSDVSGDRALMRLRRLV